MPVTPSTPEFPIYRAHMYRRNPKWKGQEELYDPYIKVMHMLATARVKSGYSQSALAEELCAASSGVGRFENGSYEPTLSWLMRYAAILGYDIEIKLNKRAKKKG